mmetsp:Transcript_28981/g.68936  ORF Transcript_28981/g.68936 Transcript_28981/m.68936 type:complete len:217 (-) Transcript_28981:24-674(-)
MASMEVLLQKASADFERNVSGATTAPDEEEPLQELPEVLPPPARPQKLKAARATDAEVQDMVSYLASVGALQARPCEEEDTNTNVRRTCCLLPEDYRNIADEAYFEAEWQRAESLTSQPLTLQSTGESFQEEMTEDDWEAAEQLMKCEQELPSRSPPLVPGQLSPELDGFEDAWRPLKCDRIVHVNQQVSECLYSVSSERSRRTESLLDGFYLSFC